MEYPTARYSSACVPKNHVTPFCCVGGRNNAWAGGPILTLDLIAVHRDSTG